MLDRTGPLSTLRYGYFLETMDGRHRISCVLQLAVESDQSWSRQHLGVRSFTRQDKKLLSSSEVIKLCKVANMVYALVHRNTLFVEQVEGKLNSSHEFAEEYGLPFMKAKTAKIV